MASEAGAAVIQGSLERLCGLMIRVFTAAEPRSFACFYCAVV